MKHLVIGQLQKTAKFSGLYWSPSRSQAFIGQLLGASRVVHIPKRTVMVLFIISIIRSDRNGPILILVATDFYHTGCLITLSDRNCRIATDLLVLVYPILTIDLLSADFDFKFRCTLILSVLGPFSRPSMSLQPILTLYFDALGPFRTRTLFPPPPCLATWKR